MCMCIHQYLFGNHLSKQVRFVTQLVCLLCWQETDDVPDNPVDIESADLEMESEDAHVPETVRMMQMVDRDLEDLLLADDAWMMTW